MTMPTDHRTASGSLEANTKAWLDYLHVDSVQGIYAGLRSTILVTTCGKIDPKPHEACFQDTPSLTFALTS